MTPTIQRTSAAAAVIFGGAPLGYGLMQALADNDDRRALWMAVVATVYAAGVLAAAVGQRRSRRAASTQAIVILVVATLLAAGTGYLLRAEGVGIWLLAAAFGGSLALASVFVALARRDPPPGA